MAGKADFTEEEWDQLRKGATGAGLLVSVSDRSFFDSIKEASSFARYLVDARDDASQLARELASEHGTGFGALATPSEVNEAADEYLRTAVATLRAKAPDDVDRIAAIGVHGLALVADATVEITLGELVIPFAAPYKPLWTGLGVIAADLAVIVDNLVENALNYSPVASTVTIEWGADGGSARLAVLDQGPGIDPAERTQIFERFYRGEAAKGGAEGTGLGLSVVEALAARWSGSVRLEDRPEGGTRAEVLLPTIAEQVEVSA